MSRYVDPERAQFEAFKALPRDVPVMMLNLVAFRDEAQYPDGRRATGAECRLRARERPGVQARRG
jgi:hypothetical protein